MKSTAPVEKKTSEKKASVSGKRDPFFQPRLTIGPPDDRYEKEADEVADMVMRKPAQSAPDLPFFYPAPAGKLSLVNRECKKCDEELRRKDIDSEAKVQMSDQTFRGKSSGDNTVDVGQKVSSGNTLFKSVIDYSGGSVQRKCHSCQEEIQKKDDETEVPVNENALLLNALPDEIESGISIQRTHSDRVNFHVQRKCAECEEEDRAVQRQESTLDVGGQEAPSVVHDAIRSGGRSMDDDVRSFMENRFGYDFGNVRIHTGSLASESAQSINALAYTSGNNIVFNEGQYAPEHDSGKQLLAHELTHVVQQTGGVQQKKPNASIYDNVGLVSPISATGNQPVQRFIFWHEFLGGIKPRTGTEIHKELTPSIAGSTAETEAPIPNANRTGSVGFAESGRADFYKADRRIGIYFKHPVVGVCRNGEGLGTPATLIGGGRTSAPRLSKGKIEDVANAPASVTLGELKPSTPELIQFGKDQLAYYEKGIDFAARQTNCWSENNSSSTPVPQWPGITFSNFNAQSLPVPAEFQPGSVGQNRSLGVIDFVGIDEYDRNAIKPQFTPKKDVRFEVKGGLFARHANGGVIGYYFYPDDPADVLRRLSIDPKDAKVRAYAEFATHLHNQIVVPLFSAPAKIQAKKKGNVSSVVTSADKNKNEIRRAPKKNSKLKDDFKLADWNRNHQTHQNNFNQKLTETREALQMTELLYKAEEAVKRTGGTSGLRSLPSKSGLGIELQSKDPQKKERKNLSSLYSWMNVWAKEPMKFLGKLRDKFGGAFVAAANRFEIIKKKFQKLLRKSREKNEPKGLSYGAIAVRAFWRAMVQAGDLVFDQTIELLVTSLEIGLKNKVQQLIPVDTDKLSEMADQNFPQFKELEKQIEALEKEVEARLEDINQKFETELEQIKEIAKDAETLGKVIKWAMVALNCASPPGWGCLKLLAKKLIAKMIDEILKWCPVQQEFSKLVAKSGFVQNLPKKTAGIAADFIESLLPSSINPVFDRTVFDHALPIAADEIKCEGGISEEQKALVELEEKLKAKLGEDGFEALVEAARIYGVPPDEPLLASEINEMMEKIPDGVTAEALQIYILSNPKRAEGKGQTFNVAEFLDIVNKSQLPKGYEWFVVAHPPAQGHAKGESLKVSVSVSPVQTCAQWSPTSTFEVPARVTKRVFYDKKTDKLQIYYQAMETVRFEMGGEVHEIKESKVFHGFRPDVCKK